MGDFWAGESRWHFMGLARRLPDRPQTRAAPRCSVYGFSIDSSCSVWRSLCRFLLAHRSEGQPKRCGVCRVGGKAALGRALTASVKSIWFATGARWLRKDETCVGEAWTMNRNKGGTHPWRSQRRRWRKSTLSNPAQP